MAADTPEPRTVVGGSSQEPEALQGDGDPPPLEGSSEPSAHTQHFPGPSLEESRDGGTSLEVPHAFVPSTTLPVEPVAPVLLTLEAKCLGHARQRAKQLELSAQKDFDEASRSPSPAPLIASVLGKRPPSPPLLHPLPRR